MDSKRLGRYVCLHVGFNQDVACVVVGTRHGFSIYNISPKITRRYYDNSEGIGKIEMLYCTGLLALAGSGDTAGSSPRLLKLYNSVSKEIFCLIPFPSTILGICLNMLRLIVCLESQIHIFDLQSSVFLQVLNVSPNPCGIIALTRENKSILAFPELSSEKEYGDVVLYDCISLRLISKIKAHKKSIVALEFNNEGTMIATASVTGTIIRVFKVPSGDHLFTFRRGSYTVHINSLSFCPLSLLLAVGSSTGTVHVFALDHNPSLSTILSKYHNNYNHSSPQQPIKNATIRSSATIINENMRTNHLDLKDKTDIKEDSDTAAEEDEDDSSSSQSNNNNSNNNRPRQLSISSNTSTSTPEKENREKSNSTSSSNTNTNTTSTTISHANSTNNTTTTTTTTAPSSVHPPTDSDWFNASATFLKNNNWQTVLKSGTSLVTSSVQTCSKSLFQFGGDFMPEPVQEFAESYRAVFQARLPAAECGVDFRAAFISSLQSNGQVALKIVAVTYAGYLYKFALPLCHDSINTTTNTTTTKSDYSMEYTTTIPMAHSTTSPAAIPTTTGTTTTTSNSLFAVFSDPFSGFMCPLEDEAFLLED